jgi:hypothetical protein
MADKKFVPLDTFLTTVRSLSSQISHLTVSVMTLRAALIHSQSLPVSPDELKRLHGFFYNYAPIRAAREAIENPVVSTTEDASEAIVELLKEFEGSIQ